MKSKCRIYRIHTHVPDSACYICQKKLWFKKLEEKKSISNVIKIIILKHIFRKSNSLNVESIDDCNNFEMKEKRYPFVQLIQLHFPLPFKTKLYFLRVGP